jgi:hypothetical protein
MSHQLLGHTDEHLSDLLLLSAGEVRPQLMRSNRVVARAGGRSGRMN